MACQSSTRLIAVASHSLPIVCKYLLFKWVAARRACLPAKAASASASGQRARASLRCDSHFALCTSHFALRHSVCFALHVSAVLCWRVCDLSTNQDATFTAGAASVSATHAEMPPWNWWRHCTPYLRYHWLHQPPDLPKAEARNDVLQPRLHCLVVVFNPFPPFRLTRLGRSRLPSAKSA